MNFKRAALRDVLNYLNDVAYTIAQKHQADGVSIYTYNAETKGFKLLSMSGRVFSSKKFKRLRLDFEIPFSFISRKSPVSITKTERFGVFQKIKGSLIAVPLFSKKSLRGLLLVYFAKKNIGLEFMPKFKKDAHLIGTCLHSFEKLGTMSGQISGLKIVDDMNRIVVTELNLERLYERIYEQVKRIVKVKNLRIDLFDAERHILTPVFFINNGEHYTGHPGTRIENSKVFAQVVKKRDAVLISEYNRLLKKFDQTILSTDMKVASFIALPLIVRDTFLGILTCWDKNKKNIFTAHVINLLKLMAGQSAIAIYNAKLFNQLNKAINNLTLLYQIEYHISSILGIEDLLKTTVNLIDSALDGIITTILLPDEEGERLLIKAMTPGVDIKPGFDSVPLYRGIIGEAMKKKRDIYVPDVSKAEHYVPAIDGIGSELAIPLMAGTRILGVIDFQSKKKDRFDLMTIDLLDDIAHRIATFLENAMLYEKLEKNYTETIRALVLAMEAKDSYTRGHSERVTELALRLAERMGIADGRKKVLYYAGLLHDIGKIAISESILNKPGRLDEFEFAEIKKHPVEGAKMLEEIEGLKDVVPIIRHHHENFDGTGYPDGLKGMEIPLESRILAVCDVYDAMTTVRSYRKPFSYNSALVAIASFIGTKLDPQVVSEFIKMMRTEKEGRQR
ncbi:MAG: GAF and HD-GYP domain-containing protein [bacterium]